MAGLATLILIALLIAFLFGMFRMAEQQRSGGNTTARQRPRRDVVISQAASQAMHAAQYEAGDSFVSVTDIGLLAYRTPDESRLIRYGDVLMDTEYLRPFVELWLPHAARGPVRFEFFDGRHHLRYADEERYDLARGKNTLLPNTWLPLRGKAVDASEMWSMRVLVGTTLLAVGHFGWQAVGGGEIQRYVESDGEISPELQRAIRSSPGRSMSLGELLADQEK